MGLTEKLKKETFYKYRSLKDMSRFLDIIVNNRLYGAYYSELNDPMEGKFNHKGLKKADLDEIYKELESTRICSLMQKQPEETFPDNFLMWSHYADGHRGCCIELKVTGRYNGYWDLVPVIYQKSLPMIEKGEDKIKRIVSSKDEIWSHEHEYRAIRQSAKKYSSPFYHIKVVSIYLGKKINAEDRKFYTKIIKAINLSIRLYCIKEERSNTGMYPKLKSEAIE